VTPGVSAHRPSRFPSEAYVLARWGCAVRPLVSASCRAFPLQGVRNLATQGFVGQDSRHHVFFRPGQLSPREDWRSSHPAFIHSCGSFHPGATTRWAFDGPHGMLLSPRPFGSRLAIDPRTSPCVLACLASDMLPREAAHVAKLFQPSDMMALDAGRFQLIKIVGAEISLWFLSAQDVRDDHQDDGASAPGWLSAFLAVEPPGERRLRGSCLACAQCSTPPPLAPPAREGLPVVVAQLEPFASTLLEALADPCPRG
jgi:hypothetical protein